ncbi:unnamed protein product [Amoebophrya sp. A120]|nr:unnamed protein product [Amoebophrya sp. A120]|eukprot:GSA120T00016496001.1
MQPPITYHERQQQRLCEVVKYGMEYDDQHGACGMSFWRGDGFRGVSRFGVPASCAEDCRMQCTEAPGCTHWTYIDWEWSTWLREWHRPGQECFLKKFAPDAFGDWAHLRRREVSPTEKTHFGDCGIEFQHHMEVLGSMQLDREGAQKPHGIYLNPNHRSASGVSCRSNRYIRAVHDEANVLRGHRTVSRVIPPGFPYNSIPFEEINSRLHLGFVNLPHWISERADVAFHIPMPSNYSGGSTAVAEQVQAADPQKVLSALQVDGGESTTEQGTSRQKEVVDQVAANSVDESREGDDINDDHRDLVGVQKPPASQNTGSDESTTSEPKYWRFGHDETVHPIISKIGRAAVRYRKTASGKWKMEEKLVASLPDEDVYPRIGRAIQVGYQVAAGRLLETSVSRESDSIAVYSWSKGAEDENGLVSEVAAKAITTVCAERIALVAQKEPAAQVLQLARSEVETTWKTHDEIYSPAWDDEVFIQEDEEEKFQMWHELLSKELAPLPEPEEGDARMSIKKLKGAMKERLEDWIRKQNDEELRLRGRDEREAGVAALGN